MRNPFGFEFTAEPKLLANGKLQHQIYWININGFPLHVIQLCPYLKKKKSYRCFLLLRPGLYVLHNLTHIANTLISTHLLNIHIKSYHDITFVCQIPFSLCKFVTPVVQLKSKSMKQEKVWLKKPLLLKKKKKRIIKIPQQKQTNRTRKECLDGDARFKSDTVCADAWPRASLTSNY